jgi:general secretion pathway protein G
MAVQESNKSMIKLSSPTLLSRRAGFTMIELLVVTTIIIVLSTIGLISFRQTGMNARNGKRKADLENIRSSLVLYRTDNGSYPATSDFDTMLTTISDYTSSVSITDPKNDDVYVYEYTSAGPTFTLTAYLEPDAEAYTLTNP